MKDVPFTKFFDFCIDHKPFKANIVESDGDGNCLFTAISHQIDPNAIDASALRKEITNELENNSNDPVYLKALINHVVEYDDKILRLSNRGQKQEVEKLIEKLKKDCIYGGGESIIAAGRLHKTNVLTISEHHSGKSSVKLDHFDCENNRIILLGYNPSVKHYDSVVGFQDLNVIKAIQKQIQSYLNTEEVDLTV